jgi:hypothetical protein
MIMTCVPNNQIKNRTLDILTACWVPPSNSSFLTPPQITTILISVSVFRVLPATMYIFWNNVLFGFEKLVINQV